jgi:hypothetical protein
MKTLKSICLLALVVFFANSCKDKDQDPTPTPVVLTGGTGGTFTLTAHVEHHGVPIPNARVFLKYAANEHVADTSKYDERKTEVVHHGGQPHAHFSKLTAGTYWVYAVGYDSTLTQADKTVKGGVSGN